MSPLGLHNAPPRLHVGNKCLNVDALALLTEAPAPTGTDEPRVHGGPSHHSHATFTLGLGSGDHRQDDDDDNDDSAWLSDELSPWFDGDWLDAGATESSGAPLLQWYPPDFGTPLPQSPTSVDWSSATAPATPPSTPSTMTKYVDPFPSPDIRDDAVAVKPETRTRAASRRGRRRSPPTPKTAPVKREDSEDSDSVQQAHERWVSGAAQLENRRQRQREYERTYRQNKQRSSKAQFADWAAKEIELYLLMKHHSTPFRVDQPRATLAQLVQEERAARVDNMVLTTLARWQQLYELRNYSDSKAIRTRDAWARIDRALLGPCVIKPFRPFRHEFQW